MVLPQRKIELLWDDSALEETIQTGRENIKALESAFLFCGAHLRRAVKKAEPVLSMIYFSLPGRPVTSAEYKRIVTGTIPLGDLKGAGLRISEAQPFSGALP